jgi:hypothetical protein
VKLTRSRKNPKQGLSVYLADNNDGAISLMAKLPSGDSWFVFRLNADGTGSLHSNVPHECGFNTDEDGCLVLTPEV